jgi:hypothetical protein
MAHVVNVGSVVFTGYARAGVAIQELVLTPDVVNVGADSAQVTISVHVTDDRRAFGITHGAAQFYNPTATQTTFKSLLTTLRLVSGTPSDGVWRGTLTVPKGAEAGAWPLGRLTIGWGCGGPNRVELFDSELKSFGLPHLLQVNTTLATHASLAANSEPTRAFALQSSGGC